MQRTDISPLDAHKIAKASYTEWQKYMEDMCDETSASLRQNGPRNNGSILGED